MVCSHLDVTAPEGSSGMTGEHRAAFAQLQSIARPFRLRVTADAEGFPIISGRYGRIEWFCDGIRCWSCPLPGQFALAVYSDRTRLFGRLLAIPGAKRHQAGDQEMRVVFPPGAVEEVARLIRARKRRVGRPLSPEAAKKLRGPRVGAT
jgi:hypothetical protein